MITVLIVDDDPIVVHGLKSILRAVSEIEVVGTAEDGLKAVDEALRLRPRLILMDAQISEDGGLEATRRIREGSPESRLLFMAVHMADIDTALEAGADGYVMKDSGRRELLRAITRLAGLKNGRRETA